MPTAGAVDVDFSDHESRLTASPLLMGKITQDQVSRQDNHVDGLIPVLHAVGCVHNPVPAVNY